MRKDLEEVREWVTLAFGGEAQQTEGRISNIDPGYECTPFRISMMAVMAGTG